jgi:hypothetical protein
MSLRRADHLSRGILPSVIVKPRLQEALTQMSKRGGKKRGSTVKFGSLFYDYLFESESTTDVLKFRLGTGRIIRGKSNIQFFKVLSSYNIDFSDAVSTFALIVVK